MDPILDGKLLDERKTALLVKVAKLYYEEDMGQEAIAKSIGLSRPYISRLLAEAKEMGIIQFRIIDPLKGESDLERKLN